eukprot:CAMPEP_0114246570 /NCGR_PEP_ID=MMETSP0058-20121206/12540_1 /TAXON_ID=36894 /ORGANISM="Pyramimonas parkeae, CCMP726" /LENGTH=418 /DNA_ID=CAMNT_0001359779 /DNA_START=190 /DNA_END=1447 /DNA_ORIENTATION=-
MEAATRQTPAVPETMHPYPWQVEGKHMCIEDPHFQTVRAVFYFATLCLALIALLVVFCHMIPRMVRHRGGRFPQPGSRVVPQPHLHSSEGVACPRSKSFHNAHEKSSAGKGVARRQGKAARQGGLSGGGVGAISHRAAGGAAGVDGISRIRRTARGLRTVCRRLKQVLSMRLARPLRAVACQMNAKFKVPLLANVSASRRLVILICIQLGRACSAGTALLITYLHTCKAIVVTFRNTLYGVLCSAGSGLVRVFASCVFTRPIDSEVNGGQLNFESSPRASQARSPCSEPKFTVSSCHESGSAIMPRLPTRCNVANHNGDEFSNLDQFGFKHISRLFRKDTANGEERHHELAAEEDIEHQVEMEGRVVYAWMLAAMQYCFLADMWRAVMFALKRWQNQNPRNLEMGRCPTTSALFAERG